MMLSEARDDRMGKIFLVDAPRRQACGIRQYGSSAMVAES